MPSAYSASRLPSGVAAPSVRVNTKTPGLDPRVFLVQQAARFRSLLFDVGVRLSVCGWICKQESNLHLSLNRRLLYQLSFYINLRRRAYSCGFLPFWGSKCHTPRIFHVPATRRFFRTPGSSRSPSPFELRYRPCLKSRTGNAPFVPRGSVSCIMVFACRRTWGTTISGPVP